MHGRSGHVLLSFHIGSPRSHLPFAIDTTTHHAEQLGCLHGVHALVARSSPPVRQLVHCGRPLSSNVQASQSVPQLRQASFHSPNPVSQNVHLVLLAQLVQLAEQRTQALLGAEPQPASHESLSQRPAPAVSHTLQPSAQATQRPVPLSMVYPEALQGRKSAGVGGQGCEK